MKPNYKKIFAIKAECENRIKKVCPDMPHASGIYVFYRIDEAGIRRAYCGQAVDLVDRCAQHLTEYDHIALSLKKHKFYSDNNPYGWKLSFITCSKDELDEREIRNIRSWADAGWQLYNVSSGGQGIGKIISDGYKQPKTYREGIQQGRKSLAKELAHIIEKHLIVAIKPEKANNKVSQDQFAKFWNLLNTDERELDDGDIQECPNDILDGCEDS